MLEKKTLSEQYQKGIEGPEKRLLAELRQKALESPRKRAVFMLSEPEANNQVMLNFFLKDSYVRPHRHNRPEQEGSITALLGSFSVIKFNDDGSVQEIKRIEHSDMVPIMPNVWHGIVCLSDEGLIFETNGGLYDSATDKEFATWAPEEGSPDAPKYLDRIRSL